jgi:hypothetical protein
MGNARPEGSHPAVSVNEILEPTEVLAGTAGASARREFERLKAKRETDIRAAHPRIGGFLLAVSDDPQSTKAWAVGAEGEQRLGRRLDGLVSDHIRVLHDRRLPRSAANIDHIVVCPTGVFVIDAKKWRGRPNLRIEGGLFTVRTEKLIVGSRSGARAVEGVHGQVAKVKSALESVELGQIPVNGMLCFVEADWPLFGGDFVVEGVRVLWPAKAASHIVKAGPMDAAAVELVHRELAAAFVSA